MGRPIVIITDLDETLLERMTYSFEKAEPALRVIRNLNIPLVICSSKTKAEIEVYREKLGIRNHPFISENGGGIFVPHGYFEHISGYSLTKEDGYEVITLGAPYRRLRRVVEELRSRGFGVTGFGDMEPEEISFLTGLSPDESRMAKERHFDEPFIFNGDTDALRKEVQARALNVTEGRLFHLIGPSDKGKAVDIVKDLYLSERPDTAFIALGDSPTDASMLGRVDYPVLVQKDDGSYDPRVNSPGIIRAKGIGPEGWNEAVLKLLGELGAVTPG
jgi:mannosyl-3-phosphoglycerate phosphatase family protein